VDDSRAQYSQGEVGAFLRTIVEFAVVVLVILGVGGTLYRLVLPGGWLAGLFSRSAAAGVAGIFSILIVAFSCWQLRHWVSARVRRYAPEFFAYGFAAAGLCYAVQMYTGGGP